MNKVTLAIVGGGGRESVLAAAYSQSPQVGKIVVMPGNDLMQSVSKVPVVTFPDIKTNEVDKIMAVVKKERVALVDIAQEAAVEVGLGDRLEQEGILYMGPKRDAGQLEWDKAWAREFMRREGIAHPQYMICHNVAQGKAFLQQQPEGKWFIKAAGLAEGKGVLPAESNAQAAKRMAEMTRFGQAGETFLIEEWLEGEEFSTYVVSDGERYQTIGSAQDHKREYTFDEGENTGGMGCSSPPLLLTAPIMKKVETDIIAKTIAGMRKLDRPYTGILYLGGMVVTTKAGPKPYVIEFNARWGDPEAEVVVPGIKTDLFTLSMLVAKRDISKVKVKTDGKARVAVVGASRGYPADYSAVKGKRIYGIEEASKLPGVEIYGAGVKREGKKDYAHGGRLFHIVGEGKNVIEAREKAYGAMARIFVEGNNLHYRTDIGWRDVERLSVGA